MIYPLTRQEAAWNSDHSEPGRSDQALGNMSFRVFGIGEALWDSLPTGRQLGGAPANFTYHAHNLGADASLITRIGDDFLGKEALQQFKHKHLSSKLIQIDTQHPTGMVDVTFPTPCNPKYIIRDNAAWDYLEATQLALESIGNADAICFGSLSQRSTPACGAINSLLQAAPKNSLVVFDINLRQTFFTPATLEKSLQLANILKLNADEMMHLSRLFKINGTHEQKISWLTKTYDLHTVALTLGSEGSMLYHRGDWSTEPAKKIDIMDTIGAGDAFTAALVMGLLQGLKPNICHQFATEVSGYVCSQPGGMPPYPQHL